MNTKQNRIDLPSIKFLMDKVVAKSGMHKRFEDFDTGDLDVLADIITQKMAPKIGKPSHSNEIAGRTLLDYRDLLYRDKDKGAPSTTKLNLLAQYSSDCSWKEFGLKYGIKAESENIPNLYVEEHIYDYLARSDLMERIFKRSEENLRKNRQIDDIFNLAICFLHQGNFQESGRILLRCLKETPWHVNTHFFFAISLFQGKRPFRHDKMDIDEIIYHLNQGEKIAANRHDIRWLKLFVINDFYLRTGYSHPSYIEPTEPIHDELTRLISLSTDLTIPEVHEGLKQ